MLSKSYECTSQESANALLVMGFPVMLCDEESPIDTDWRIREFSAGEIDREFQEHGDLNVGLVLGPRYGLIEVVTREGNGNQSHREFYELMDGAFPETPTFESRFGFHYIFGWNKRLGSLGEAEFQFKSVMIRVGAGEVGAFTLLPPSIVDGFQREWRLTMDDHYGGIAWLPDYAVDRILAAVPSGIVH